MQTANAVSKPSPKVPSAAPEASGPGPSSGAEGAGGDASKLFSDLIAQAGEPKEAAQQPSATDVLPALPTIALNLPPQGAAPAGPGSESLVGSKRLLAADARPSGDGLAGEGGPDPAALVGTAADDSRGAHAGDVKAGSRGLAEALAGGSGQPAAVTPTASGASTPAMPNTPGTPTTPTTPNTPNTLALPSMPDTAAMPDLPDLADGAMQGAAAPAGPARMGLQALDAAATAAAATVGAAAAAASAARPAAGAAGADGSADRGGRLRRAAIDTPPDGRVDARAHGLEVGTAVASPGASAHQSNDSTAHLAGPAASGADLQATGAAATGAAPGALGGNGGTDASVFALTMNQAQATGTLAATRSEMMAEMTQSAIDVPVDHADFAESFARQSAGLIVQGNSSAEIRLTPQDMGPIRIAITLDADAVSLDMAAEHAETRAAIEASMPALRQMLADQGVRLADWRLASDPTADRQQPTSGDAGRRNGEQDPGSSNGGGTQQAAADAARDAGNAFANGRGTNQFNRHGGGWTSGMAPTAGAGMSRADPGDRSGGSRLDLYA